MSVDSEFGDMDEYAILIKNNELIKTKLENLQFQNSRLKAQLGTSDDDLMNLNKGFFKTPLKTKEVRENDEIDKESFFLMMTCQAGVIENFLNEKVL